MITIDCNSVPTIGPAIADETKQVTMLLEDASSRSLSSVDFGRAAQDAAASPKGIALPPPTEFIHAPSDILDAEAALIAARREKSSVIWKIRVSLERLGDLTRAVTRRFVELMSKKNRNVAFDDLPPVEVSREIDLQADDDADTARNPTPVPFPAARRDKGEKRDKRDIKEQQAPKRKNAKQWEVTTQVVDMGTRKKGKGTRPNSKIPTSDLTLDDD